jgi:GcrA cell cycle regulator
MKMGDFWTPEKVETLRVQWAEGRSARSMADLLGCTKNAVLGKARRISLPMHPDSCHNPDRPRKPKKFYPPKPRSGHFVPRSIKYIRLPAPIAPDTLNIAFLDLEPHHCRYPVTRDHPHLFCGVVKDGDSSYCAFHHALCHEKPRARIDRVANAPFARAA